jgi:hypothetical protein
MHPSCRCRTVYGMVPFHPSYCGLSPYPAVRQRHYRTLFTPSPDPTLDARAPGWSTQRAVGSAAFVARVTPPAGPPDTCCRAATNSGTWSVRGDRYLL